MQPAYPGLIFLLLTPVTSVHTTRISGFHLSHCSVQLHHYVRRSLQGLIVVLLTLDASFYVHLTMIKTLFRLPLIHRAAVLVCAYVMCVALGHGTALSQTDSLNKAFIAELNQMRANPKAFIPQIEAYRRQLSSFTHNKKALNIAVAEIKQILAKQQPLSQLTLDSALMQATREHMMDGAKAGFIGHIGSDHSDPGVRAARYGRFIALSEAITYGHLSTSLMLAAFLVDEGTPSRGHRMAMLSPVYTLVGAAYGPHPKYDSHIVVLLGKK